MSTLTIPQALKFASQAGFKNSSLQTIVAISICESGLDTGAVGPLGEIGITQVYPKAHPQYTRSCLFDPLCNYKAAWEISSHGTNWHPWTTYENGCYKTHLVQVAFYMGSSLSTFEDNPSNINTPVQSPIQQQFLGGFIGSYHSIADTSHQILNNVPGFLAIEEALDISEQFQPFQLPKQSNVNTATNTVVNDLATAVFGPTAPVLLAPIEAGLKGVNPITLPADWMQAFLVFFVTNLRAGLLRGSIMMIGLVIVIAMMINLMNPSEKLDQVMPFLEGAL